jgi:uncharacterized membrane protein YcaP (DUF421 family)
MDAIIRDIWQTALVFASLLVLARLLGKTQVGQLTFYEYICGITIGSIGASVVASEPGQLWNHYFDLLLFCALTYAAARLTLVNQPLRKLLEGSPTLIIENGRILEENMRGMRFDVAELMGQLREKGIFDVADVQYAFLETTGSLSIMKKAAAKTVTLQDLNIQQGESRLPVELIIDGEVLAENLPRAGVSAEWLRNQLAARGVRDQDKVVYAAFDSRGNFQVNIDNK